MTSAKSRPVALLLFLTFNFIPVIVRSDVSTSKLQIHIPQSLSVKDGYDHRDALFGIPPYGGSIQGNLYYTSESLCGTALVSPATGYPIEKDAAGHVTPWQSPYILMLDRGNCTFVQKVRNAQRAGAAAVLIADTLCQCSSRECVMSPGQEYCETQEPIMADDGSGADISIPSFLVFKQDADKMKETLTKNQQIRAELTFSVPSPDSRVEYELYTTPSDALSFKFLSSFQSAAVALAQDASFTPYMYIINGIDVGCHAIVSGEDYCSGLCTNAGRYCATDPDGNLDDGVSGADVVAESLRRICIWAEYGSKDGIGTPWWNYVTTFLDTCGNPDTPKLFTDATCVDAAMKSAQIDVNRINKCMAASGSLAVDEKNELLEMALGAVKKSGAFLIPSLFVNQAPIRGMLSYSTVFKAICSGYSSGYEPAICKSCANCNLEEKCVDNNGVCRSGYDGYQVASTSGVSSATFVSSMMSVSLLFCIAGYIVYQRQQLRMRDEVRGIMAEYMPVGSTKNSSENTVSDESEFTIT